MLRIYFSMQRWKSGRSRALLKPETLRCYVIRNLYRAGCGCTWGRAPRTFRRADEICTALELRKYMADFQSGGNGRPALDAYDCDRPTFEGSVFTYSNVCARSHRGLWTMLGNWIRADRLRNESSRDRSRNGDHPGTERVIGITDPITHSQSSTVSHISRPHLPGWNCDYAGGDRILCARGNAEGRRSEPGRVCVSPILFCRVHGLLPVGTVFVSFEFFLRIRRRCLGSRTRSWRKPAVEHWRCDRTSCFRRLHLKPGLLQLSSAQERHAGKVHRRVRRHRLGLRCAHGPVLVRRPITLRNRHNLDGSIGSRDWLAFAHGHDHCDEQHSRGDDR